MPDLGFLREMSCGLSLLKAVIAEYFNQHPNAGTTIVIQSGAGQMVFTNPNKSPVAEVQEVAEAATLPEDKIQIAEVTYPEGEE